MAFKSLAYRAGINTQFTKTLVGDGYADGQLIRFQTGQPQKFGGWQRLSSTPVTGTCRGLFGWSDLFGNPYLAAGTEQKLEIFYGGTFYDITPVASTSTLTNTAISTTSGSKVVTITDGGHSPAAGDWINIVMPVAVGTAGNSLVLFGEYQVQTTDPGTGTYTITAATVAPATSTAGHVPYFTTANTTTTITVTLNSHGLSTGNGFTVQYTTTVGGVIIAPVTSTGGGGQLTPPQTYVITKVDADNFTFTQPTTASSTASAYENGANSIIINYYLATGYVVDTPTTSSGGNLVYGSGAYGGGAYGGGATSTTQIAPLRQWFFNSWGQTLIANPSNLGLYYWIPSNASTNPLAFITPATIIPNSPTYNTLSLVLAQAQILISFGAESGGVQYPNLIRWSDVADYTDWTATATNEAGSFQIPSGSKIISALASGLSILIWTDTDLWSMTYQGLPFVFDFQRIGINCEALSAKSVGVIGQRVCWPSDRGFYQFDGATVSPLFCPVWDFFFDNVDLDDEDQVFCGTNTLFTEFMWFFPYGQDTGVTGYVKYNLLENTWDKGFLSRTAWIDHSPFGNPIGAEPPATSGLLMLQEVGMDADIHPMTSYITTGFSPIGDGEEFQYIDAFFPDLITNGTNPSMTITFYGADAQSATPVQYGPYMFSPSTQYVSVRIRGRLLGYTVGSGDSGSFWRIGRPYIRVAPAGRR